MTRTIIWSPRSKRDYIKLIDYLIEEWGEKSSDNFKSRLREVLNLISENPSLYQASKKKSNVRRCVVSKHISLYYRAKEREIELITLFDTRQHPSKRKLK